MGSNSGFPIAYARCSWARLCAIKTAGKIKVAHYPDLARLDGFIDLVGLGGPVKLGIVLTFSGHDGKHASSSGENCAGRNFVPITVGSGGAFTTFVKCTTCERELAAWEHGLMASQQQVVFHDEHIIVGDAGFDPADGTLKLEIHEKHEGSVGFYYITVTFDSGNATRIDYDGGNPRRVKNPIVQTWEKNDSVKDVKAVRVRD